MQTKDAANERRDVRGDVQRLRAMAKPPPALVCEYPDGCAEGLDEPIDRTADDDRSPVRLDDLDAEPLAVRTQHLHVRWVRSHAVKRTSPLAVNSPTWRLPGHIVRRVPGMGIMNRQVRRSTQPALFHVSA